MTLIFDPQITLAPRLPPICVSLSHLDDHSTASYAHLQPCLHIVAQVTFLNCT